MYALQWLNGLRLLGHEVLYYDRVDERPESAALFGTIVERWWDRRLAAALRKNGQSAFGLSVAEVEAFSRDAAGIIQLGCQFSAEPDLWVASVRPRVFIDADPGFSQLRAMEGSAIDEDLHGPSLGRLGRRGGGGAAETQSRSVCANLEQGQARRRRASPRLEGSS